MVVLPCVFACCCAWQGAIENPSSEEDMCLPELGCFALYSCFLFRINIRFLYLLIPRAPETVSLYRASRLPSSLCRDDPKRSIRSRTASNIDGTESVVVECGRQLPGCLRGVGWGDSKVWALAYLLSEVGCGVSCVRSVVVNGCVVQRLLEAHPSG